MRTLFILGIAVTALAPTLTACATHQCDPHSTTVGTPDAGVGTWDLFCSAGGNCSMTWRSSDVFSVWTPFTGNETLTFTLPPLPVPPDEAHFEQALPPQVWVASAAPTVPEASTNFTEASGQLAEFTGLPTSMNLSLSVLNASCADYAVLVALTVPVTMADGAATDGGTTADGGAATEGGSGDAGSD